MTICETHNEEKTGKPLVCKSCRREYQARWFEENKEVQRARVRANTKRSKERNRRYVSQYLRSHPCVDCGETDPVVLEFDHQENKVDAICNMIRRCVSLKKLAEEIKKCEVRCANCHRRKTSSDFGYWRESI